MTATTRTVPDPSPARPAPAVNRQRALRETIVLQALAALLIANSHLEAFYPYAWMAGDGLLGNSMFFFLSGLGLARSELAHRRPFGEYLWRRLTRIYPTMWVTLVIFGVCLTDMWRHWDAYGVLWRFTWPTVWDYIRLIVPFYVIFYFLLRIRSPRLLWRLALLLVIPFAILFATTIPAEGYGRLQLGCTDKRMWTVFYFQTTLLGAYAGMRSDWPAVRRAAAWGLLIAACVAYVGCKLAMVLGKPFPGTQVSTANAYPLLLALTLLIIHFAWRLLAEPRFLAAVQRIRPVAWVVGLVGSVTLEIYLSHEYYTMKTSLPSVRFPWNLVLFFPIMVATAWGVAQVTSLLTGLVGWLVARGTGRPK